MTLRMALHIFQCEHTATQVGLPSCPKDKAQKSWHQRRLLVHFWGLDVLDQGQAPCPQRLSQYQLLEVLSWREREAIFWACCSWPNFAPFRSMLIRFFLIQRVKATFNPKPSLLHCNFHKQREQTGHTLNTCERLMTPSHKPHSKPFFCLSSLLFFLKCYCFDFHLHLFYPVGWPLPCLPCVDHYSFLH